MLMSYLNNVGEGPFLNIKNHADIHIEWKIPIFHLYSETV